VMPRKIPRTIRSDAETPCFNEAAAVMPRKILCGSGTTPRSSTSFNEAAAVMPRKMSRTPRAECESRRCFNEAAAVMPRKMARAQPVGMHGPAAGNASAARGAQTHPPKGYGHCVHDVKQPTEATTVSGRASARRLKSATGALALRPAEPRSIKSYHICGSHDHCGSRHSFIRLA
jgi:hypothetical protein